MKIRVPRKPEDDVTHHHDTPHLSRRDFIARGMYTGVMSVVLPKMILGGLVRDAVAGSPVCPSPSMIPGCIAQIYAEGGYTAGAYFQSDLMAGIAASSAPAAIRYGIDGATMQKLGPNLNISSASIFGKRIIANGAKMGFTPSAWLAILGKCSGAFNCGPLNADDGGGRNTGLIGSIGPMKQSYMNKDILMGVNSTLARFAVGSPASKVGSKPTPTNLANVFSLSPANKTNSQTMTNSANAAMRIGAALGGMFGVTGRTGGNEAITAASCGFLGNSALANPTYGASLFDPTQITALNALATNLTPVERALLSSYFQSASGMVGGVFTEYGGYDYHGQTPTQIGTAAIQLADAFTAWIAGCNAANANAAMIITSNGQAIANGFTNATVGGTTGNVQNAVGDAGGSFNNSMLIRFHATGSPAAGKNIGALNTTNGDAKPAMGSILAMQGLYASALIHVTGGLSNAQFIRLGSPDHSSFLV